MLQNNYYGAIHFKIQKKKVTEITNKLMEEKQKYDRHEITV